MFERFTDRSRKVMAFANQEAQRLNHDYINTEHILLGLVKEGSGVAAFVLKKLGVDLKNVRLQVEKLVQSGPEMVTVAKLPQTPSAKRVIESAMEESRSLNHNYVGTEHLLLGLLREMDGTAAKVLANLGVKLERVREEVLDLLGTPADTATLHSSSVSAEALAAGIPEQLKDHPLVKHYQALIDAFAAERDYCAGHAKLEWLAEADAHLDVLRFQLETLLAWLHTDPNFGTRAK